MRKSLELIAAIMLSTLLAGALHAQDNDADLPPLNLPKVPEGETGTSDGDIDDFFGPLPEIPRPRRSSDRPLRPTMPGMPGYGPVQMGPFDTMVCGEQSLASTLANSDGWYKIMAHKRRTGFLPSRQFRADIKRRIARDTAPLTAALKRFSDSAPTYALIFGQKDQAGCVWLAGPEGIIANGLSSYDTTPVVENIWVGLEVQARSRGVRAARSGRDCPAYEEQPLTGPGAAFLKQANADLARARKALLPQGVTDALNAIPGAQNRLLILPTGNLRKLPFAALPLGSEPLVARFAPIVIPSLSSLQNPRPASLAATSERLVIGNPDLSADPDTCWVPLPGAEREATNAARAMGNATLLTGISARHSAVLSRLQNAEQVSMVYMATHGVTDPDNPADGSFLALKERHLRGAELRNLTLTGNPLIVMSACQTGLGKEFDDGVFGLPEAWHFAGSDRIVMSLWNVSDAGTEILMAHFIEALAGREWRHADLALAQAMRATYAETQDPMIWAAFVYFGVPEN